MDKKDIVILVKDQGTRLKNLALHKRQEIVILSREIELIENERYNYMDLVDKLEKELD